MPFLEWEVEARNISLSVVVIRAQRIMFEFDKSNFKHIF